MSDFNPWTHTSACFDAWDNNNNEELRRLLAIHNTVAQKLLYAKCDCDMSTQYSLTPNEPLFANKVRTLLDAGADPWLTSYECPISIMAEKIGHRGLEGKEVDFDFFLAFAPHRYVEVMLIEGAMSSPVSNVAAIGREARRLRLSTPLQSLLSSDVRTTFRFDELANRILAYAPSREELNAADMAFDVTPLHLLCAQSVNFSATEPGDVRYVYAAHALLCAGADPLAIDASWHTPRSIMAGENELMYDLLVAAEDDTRERQLTLAMARHPRLGGASLLALLSDDIFSKCIGTSHNCVPPSPRRPPPMDYITHFTNVLAAEEGVQVYAGDIVRKKNRDGCFVDMEDALKKCVKERALITPAVRQQFRLMWAGLHATAEDMRAVEAHLGTRYADSNDQLAVLKIIFLADGRLPPITHWRMA